MSHNLTTAPTTEPLTVAEGRAHLRVDDSSDNDTIDALITTTRERVEEELGRALITQTWTLTLDRFPHGPIELPRPPLQSVTSITYIDSDGASQTWGSSLYRVDTAAQPGRITPAYGESYPTTRDVTGAVTVTFVAGYGAAAADVPRPIRQAMLLLLGHAYAHREIVVAGTIVSPIPQSMDWLLDPYRVWHL